MIEVNKTTTMKCNYILMALLHKFITNLYQREARQSETLKEGGNNGVIGVFSHINTLSWMLTERRYSYKIVTFVLTKFLFLAMFVRFLYFSVYKLMLLETLPFISLHISTRKDKMHKMSSYTMNNINVGALVIYY